MEYDPSQFVGSAAHYLAGRPAYSVELGAVLTEELGLDGTGVLVDVGAGPGTVAAELGDLFGRVIVVEPDPDMLAEAQRHLGTRGVTADFVQATAEQLGDLGLPAARMVTFGQSFHRVDRLPVAEAVHDLLEPGGAMTLITHDYLRQPHGPVPDAPPVPHPEIHALVKRYTGPHLRSGVRLVRDLVSEPFAETLARTSFGGSVTLLAPGRTDIVRDVDGVIAGVRSMSYATPAVLGDDLGPFLADLRALLEAESPTGEFWDWPGDTEITIARRR